MRMAAKLANYGEEVMRSLEKQILLLVLDKQWKDHLLSLDHLRHGIQLRAYGQRDPLNEYKKEAFDLFEGMLAQIRDEVTMLLARVELRAVEPEAAIVQRVPQEMHESRHDPAMAGMDAPEPEMAAVGGGGVDTATAPPPPRTRTPQQTVVSRQAADRVDPNNPGTWGKVPRNAACPCGSGKKYKHCHGKLA